MATLRVAIDATGARVGAARANQAFSSVKRGAVGAGAAVRGADASMAGLGRTAAVLKSQLGALLGAFVALRTVQGTVKVLRDFGETMQFVRSVAIDANLALKEQEEQFRQLSDEARNLGATTRFTATQAAEGLLSLGRAGFTTQESLDAIKATLNLATGGMFELGDASDLAAVTVRQFGLEAAETERVADVLLKTANSSTTTVQSLGEAMKFAGVLSGALGVSLEETAGAMGVLANAGLRGSIAGTSLRQIILGLQDPNTKARKTLEALGLTIEDVSVQENGLIGAFRNIVKTGATVNDFQRLFTRRAIAGALALRKNVKAFERFKVTLESAGGEAQRAADVVNDSLNGSVLALKSAFESVQLSMTGFRDGLREVIDFVTQVLRALDDIDDAQQGVSASARLVASALAGIIGALKVLFAFKFLAFLSQLRVSFIAFNVVLGASPFGVFIRLVGLTTAALTFFKDKLIDVGGQQVTLGDLTTVVWNRIKEIFAFVIDFIGTGWEKLVKFLVRLVGRIPKVIEATFKGVVNFLTKAFQSIGINWAALWKTAVEIIRRAANVIIGVFAAIGKVLFGLVERIVAFATSFAEIDFSSLDALGDSLAAIGDAFTAMLNPVNVAKDAIEAFNETQRDDPAGRFAAAVGETSQRVLNDVKFFAAGIGASIEGLSDAWRRIFDNIAKSANKLREMRETQKRALDEAEGAGLPFGESMVRDIQAARDASAKAVERLSEETQALRDLKETMGLTADEQERFAEGQRIGVIAAAAFGEGTEEAARAVEQFLVLLKEVQALRELKAFADDVGDAFSNAAGQMIDGFAAATRESESAADAFKKFGEVAVDALEDFIRTLIKAIVQQALLKPLAGAVGGAVFGAVSAKGDAFQGGRKLRAFAGGGVISSPTVFPMRDGALGLAGESGPEGILPLRRGADGRLGVIARGRAETIVNQTFNIRTPDAESFRRSQRQIADNARKQLRR